MVSITFISGLTTWWTVITLLISLPVSVANLKVTSPGATPVANSQTQLLVTWTLPTHSAAIDRIEVSTTGIQAVILNKPFTSQTQQTKLNGLQAGTTYTITIKSIDTTSRVSEQSTFVTTTGSTITIVGFDAVCSVSAVCDTSKSLECVGQTTKTCKCKTGLYYYGGTCTNNQITNLKVLGLQATAISPTQIKVDWSLPTHVSAINRFEIVWTGNAVPVTLSSSTTTYTINNLTSETSYNVVVTSVDTTSRLMEQKVHPDQVTAITSSVLGFDAECRVSADCDTSKSLECVELTTKTCKCNTDLYYYGETCKNNQIIELKVTNVQVSPTGTDSLYVTWTNPTANSVIERKEVIWTGPSQGSKTVAVGDTSTAITGLTPGGSYTITVVSIDTNSRNEQQEVTSDAVNKKNTMSVLQQC